MSAEPLPTWPLSVGRVLDGHDPRAGQRRLPLCHRRTGLRRVDAQHRAAGTAGQRRQVRSTIRCSEGSSAGQPSGIPVSTNRAATCHLTCGNAFLCVATKHQDSGHFGAPVCLRISRDRVRIPSGVLGRLGGREFRVETETRRTQPRPAHLPGAACSSGLCRVHVSLPRVALRPRPATLRPCQRGRRLGPPTPTPPATSCGTCASIDPSSASGAMDCGARQTGILHSPARTDGSLV